MLFALVRLGVVPQTTGSAIPVIGAAICRRQFLRCFGDRISEHQDRETSNRLRSNQITKQQVFAAWNGTKTQVFAPLEMDRKCQSSPRLRWTENASLRRIQNGTKLQVIVGVGMERNHLSLPHLNGTKLQVVTPLEWNEIASHCTTRNGTILQVFAIIE